MNQNRIQCFFIFSRLQGLSLQGPGADPESLRRFNSEYSRREERTSENFLNSSRKLRSSWSTITSGSIISRKHKTHVINGGTTDSLQDVRFFAELVKPLQYRLRVHEKEEKEKILFPSKYGFHQRSHSPTFRRLLEATEKLKIIAQHETVQTLLKQNANINGRKVASLKNSEADVLVEHVDESEEPKTPELTARSANIQHQTTFLTEKTSEIHDNSTVSEIPDNVSVISEELEEEEDIDDEDKSEQDHCFKVDFKVAESHAELHLFLPKISNGNKSAKNSKTDVDETSNKTDRSGQLSLPSIKVDSIHQIKSYQSQPNKKFKRPETIKKKKKKPMERVKSAADPDTKIRDHLNDVHTLISIEDHHSSHKSDTICEFAQCPYHSLLKQNQDSDS